MREENSRFEFQPHPQSLQIAALSHPIMIDVKKFDLPNIVVQEIVNHMAQMQFLPLYACL
ncbi:hypothetical protein HMPREF9422_1577 [Streptococcus cristatus ATCC 51100]|nr:hypothetical protein HMPREF9422_1577 [Streptococcus cristatus ATCC 51100]